MKSITWTCTYADRYGLHIIDLRYIVWSSPVCTNERLYGRSRKILLKNVFFFWTTCKYIDWYFINNIYSDRKTQI